MRVFDPPGAALQPMIGVTEHPRLPQVLTVSTETAVHLKPATILPAVPPDTEHPYPGTVAIR